MPPSSESGSNASVHPTADSSALPAQRAAIQAVRARYERGELSFEAFRRTLDALVLAQDAYECAAILRELPSAPASALAALEPPSSVTPAASPRQRIVAFMGQTKKLRRAWRLAERAHAIAFMGEVKLDLGLAALPPAATLRVTAIMATAVIYVPRNVQVTIRSTALLSDATALGESASGVIAFGHEQHAPPAGPDPVPQLTIEAFALMSNVKIVLTDGPVVSVADLVRDALRAAADGVRRGLLQGPEQ
jgi:hypothetical protein